MTQHVAAKKIKDLTGSKHTAKFTSLHDGKIGETFRKLPKPPKMLKTAEALAHWEEVGTELVVLDRLTRGNVRMFAIMCQLWALLAMPRTKGSQSDLPMHPVVQYRALCNEFALMPNSVPRLNAVGAPAATVTHNPFLQNKRGRKAAA